MPASGSGPEWVLHVGPHKTGSTAFQSLMAANRRSLASNGWLYPKAGGFHYGQHRIAFAMRGYMDRNRGDRPDLDNEISELRQEVQRERPERVLLSSEVFFGAPEATLGRLRDALPGPVRVIAVVRHPVERFFSAYNQRIKDPRNGFKQPISRVASAPLSFMPELDMLPFIRRWERAMGDGSVTLVPYHPAEVTQTLLAAIGYGAPLPSTARMSNQSLDARTIELIRIAKETGLPADDIRRLGRIAGGRFGTRGSYPAVTDRQLEELLHTLCPLYDMVFSTYLSADNPYGTGDVARFAARRCAPLDMPELVALLAEASKPSHLITETYAQRGRRVLGRIASRLRRG